MKLPDICIRQPVLAIVISLVLVVLGLIGFQRLEIRFFPKLQLPVVTVNTYFQGASASLMESQVTTTIENALAGIDNIQYITSSSWNSNSSITVQFRLGGNIESEAAAVRDKVSSVIAKLPPDAQTPSVTVGTKGNPLLGIGFTANNKTPAEIRDYLTGSVLPVLRQVQGVGSVSVLGASDYAMRIWLNAQKMAAYGVTVVDVKNALEANNIYFPAGSIRGPNRNFTVVSNTRLKDAQQFANIIVKKTTNGTVRMQDIAKVELGFTGFYNYPLRISGKNGILMIIEPLQSANPIKVAQRVQKTLATIKSKLPPGMQAKVTFDLSNFLSSSINETFIAIAEAIILVVLVVYFFLGSLRAASIPIITIPVSLIAVFFIIKLLGFTINTMTLLGMVLAIGLVVDDAIVMLENIHRHIEEGESPLHAAFKGSKEIAFAVLAMSITLIAVYAPVGFVQGFTAKLFQEFAFTLAGAVLISGFIALTLSPMMCSRILQPKIQDSRLTKIVDRIFERISLSYRHHLNTALHKRKVIIAVLVVIAVVGYLIMHFMSAEFLPQEDYGMMIVNINSPTGASMQYTEKYTRDVEKLLKTVPQIKSFTTQVGSDWTTIRAVLKPWNQRDLTTQQVIARLNPKLANIPGVTASASIPDVIDYGEKGSDLTLNFMTIGSYRSLLKPIDKMMADLKTFPGVYNVNSGLKFNDQQYSISINRDLAAELGVNIQDIADTVRAMMSGNHWTDVQAGSRSYEVLVQMRRQDLKNFNAINQLYVPATSSPTSTTMVPLSELVTLTPTIGQGALTHFDRLRSGTITASIAPGYTESQAIQFIQSKLPSVLTSNIRFAFSGKAAQYLESAGSMIGILLLSFVFIYLVLSAQFGSFIDPFIILLAVPLSMVGALLALWVGGGTFNLYSQIGLVTLVGMISKHGILITQFINDLRQKGVPFNEAIMRGAMIRLRPVLMTTSAMVFGSLPLALATGPGSVGRHQIGWVIVGGLIFGTFFSLVVVPIAYSYLGKFKRIDLDTDSAE